LLGGGADRRAIGARRSTGQRHRACLTTSWIDVRLTRLTAPWCRIFTEFLRTHRRRRSRTIRAWPIDAGLRPAFEPGGASSGLGRRVVRSLRRRNRRCGSISVPPAPELGASSHGDLGTSGVVALTRVFACHRAPRQSGHHRRDGHGRHRCGRPTLPSRSGTAARLQARAPVPMWHSMLARLLRRPPRTDGDRELTSPAPSRPHPRSVSGPNADRLRITSPRAPRTTAATL